MLITKKKFKKIEEEVITLKKILENLNDVVMSVFIPEEEEEVSEEELQKQQEEQVEQTLELFKTAIKASINDILNNEENQEQLANYLGQLILKAQGKADPSVAFMDPSKFTDEDGNINLGAVLVNFLIPKLQKQNQKNGSKIVPVSSNSGW